MQVNIIKNGFVDFDFDGQLEPSMYEVWNTDAPVVVMSNNDLIIQVVIGEKHFVVLAQHWQQFEESNRKELWATELYLV